MEEKNPINKSSKQVAIAFFVSLVIALCMLFLVNGCQHIPEVAQAIEDIATDDAITVKVDRDAINKQTDVNVSVEVKNNNSIK